MNRMISIVGFSLLMLAACDSAKREDVNVALDSAGQKIERTTKAVGEKIDTALTGIKSDLNASRIEGALHRMNGMDSVKVDLTSEGSARLYGHVASDSNRQLAEEVVRKTKGVIGVTNEITIEGRVDTVRVDTVVKGKKK